MMVDISCRRTDFWDVIATTTKPIIASHSSVYALCPHQRNLKDEQIKAIKNGVIQVNFNLIFDPTIEKRDALLKAHGRGRSYWQFKTATLFLRQFTKNTIQRHRPSSLFDLVIKHIEYIINLVGVDYVWNWF
jgi:membrane dipeptidase